MPDRALDPRSLTVTGLLLTAVVFVASAAAPQLLSAEDRHVRSSEDDALPDWFPANTRSLEVIEGAVLLHEPHSKSKLRGSLLRETRVPASGQTVAADEASDCGYYLEIRSNAWICGRKLRPSDLPPKGNPQPRLSVHGLVPFRYGKVRKGGAPAWNRSSDVNQTSPTAHYREGFMLATQGRPGNDVLRTRDGNFVRETDLEVFEPSRFQGVELDGTYGITELAWVKELRASVRPSPIEPVADRLMHLSRHLIRDAYWPGWVEVEGKEGVVALGSLARPTVVPPPEEVEPDEKWIDVDLDSQTLIAYEGPTPVYATTISSGRRRPDRETPVGTFRVWAKFSTTKMDNIGNKNTASDYSADAVPWVQFFNGSIALHAAYWHNSWGNRMSHGCINLAPKDARWIFEWTGPYLPDGWLSVRPGSTDPGTLIRVRESDREPEPAERRTARQPLRSP